VLAYEVSQRNPGESQMSVSAGVGGLLYFMKVPEPKTGKNRLHLDLVTPGSMEAEVARLAEAGAQLVEVRQDPASYDNPDTWPCELPVRFGFACADIYHAFNGPTGTKAAAGLLGPDYTHPSQRGNNTIASVLEALGYTPLT
jgi:hypothetical protein